MTCPGVGGGCQERFHYSCYISIQHSVVLLCWSVRWGEAVVSAVHVVDTCYVYAYIIVGDFCLYL